VGLSAKARYIAIRFPPFKLPGIDHLLPFGQQEVQAEFMATNDLTGLIDQSTDPFATRNGNRSNARSAKSQAYRLK
jgi:hypothetical protein